MDIKKFQEICEYANENLVTISQACTHFSYSYSSFYKFLTAEDKHKEKKQKLYEASKNSKRDKKRTVEEEEMPFSVTDSVLRMVTGYYKPETITKLFYEVSQNADGTNKETLKSRQVITKEIWYPPNPFILSAMGRKTGVLDKEMSSVTIAALVSILKSYSENAITQPVAISAIKSMGVGAEMEEHLIKALNEKSAEGHDIWFMSAETSGEVLQQQEEQKDG